MVRPDTQDQSKTVTYWSTQLRMELTSVKLWVTLNRSPTAEHTYNTAVTTRCQQCQLVLACHFIQQPELI